MNYSSRFTSTASIAALAALLTACGTTQPISSYPSGNYPATTAYPQPYPQNAPQNVPQANLEYGRITGIDMLQAETAPGGNPNAARNAVIGGVLGAVVGSVVGKNVNNGGNRSATTILGGVAGAAAGSQVGKNNQAPVVTNSGGYRVTIQTDGGVRRMYDVGASTGDLRVGDRVRVENGVIYRA